MDQREFDRLVLESIDPIMRQIRADHLSLPSPCTGWALGDLLRHMVGSHRGFAAAARGEAAVREVWEEVILGDDPYETYRESADLVTSAFAAPDLYERQLEIYGYGVLPAKTTLHMHAVDYLAHGWDVAKSIGAQSRLDERLCAHGMALASRWPESAFTTGDPFAAHVPISDDAPIDQKLMAYLGRDPQWTSGTA